MLKVIFSFLLAFAFISNCNALQTFNVTGDNKIKAKISPDDINRIAVKDDRIKNIFAKDNLIIRFDEDLGQIFVQPKSDLYRSFNVSIITEKGLVQDIQLTAAANEAETIILTDNRKNFNITDNQTDGYQQKIMMLLRNVIKGKKLEGYNIKNINKKFTVWNNLEITKLKEYEKKDIKISHFSVLNKTDEGIELHEVDFRFFPDIAAIAIKDKKLGAKQQTSLYMVQSEYNR